MEAKRQEINSFLNKLTHDFGHVKFSVYRTSLKLARLQEFLSLREAVNSTSAYIRFSRYDPSKDERISFKNLCSELQELLKASKALQDDQEAKRLSELQTLLVFEIFREPKAAVTPLVRVSSVLLFLILLGGDDVKVKYQFMFKVYSRESSALHRSALTRMLADTARVVRAVNEQVGAEAHLCVDRCFHGAGAINQHQFVKWALQEKSKSLVWLPTMHRLEYCKSSVHDVRCSVCSIRPIVGMRFQCLKCLNYNICQVCFFLQKVAPKSGHRLTHPHQEYCAPGHAKDELNSFARTIRNKVGTPWYWGFLQGVARVF